MGDCLESLGAATFTALLTARFYQYRLSCQSFPPKGLQYLKMIYFFHKTDIFGPSRIEMLYIFYYVGFEGSHPHSLKIKTKKLSQGCGGVGCQL